MRKYELMTIFPLDEEKSKKALEDVRKVLTDFGAAVVSFCLRLNSIQIKFRKLTNHLR